MATTDPPKPDPFTATYKKTITVSPITLSIEIVDNASHPPLPTQVDTSQSQVWMDALNMLKTMFQSAQAAPTAHPPDVDDTEHH